MSDRTHEEIAASAENMVLWTMFDHMPKSEYDFAKDYLETLVMESRADEREKAAQRVLDTWEAGALLVCEYPHHMLAEAAIAAARGEGK